MKKNIHPKYNTKVIVKCSCGNTFVTGSILDEIITELCSNCHPFYTGEQKIVDTENLVAKFEAKKQAASATSFRSKKEKMAKRKEKSTVTLSTSAGLTLKDMIAQMKR